jgi:hypothetical protein
VLAYLSRYTHRIAVSNSRLIAFDQDRVTFRYKDYRRDRADRQQVMTLAVDEFIRRFLIHVLPCGFHRVRHYGLLASSARKASLALARELLEVVAPPDPRDSDEPEGFRPPCRCCGGRMIIIETFERWWQPPGTATRIDNRPGDRSMTRHGLVENPAADAPSLATDSRATADSIAANRVATSLVGDRQDCAEAQRSGPSASTIDLPSAGRANAEIGRSSKCP